MKIFGMECWMPVVLVQCFKCGTSIDRNNTDACPLLFNTGREVKHICAVCYPGFANSTHGEADTIKRLATRSPYNRTSKGVFKHGK